MITITNLNVKKIGRFLLKDINTELPDNSVISLIGKNGSGKSTFCKSLIGSIKITSGEIKKPKKYVISYVPQIFDRSILVPITVIDFLKINRKHFNKNSEVIKDLRLEEILNSTINSLSGGEMQKVLIARAIISKPNLLILDEAFAFLDFSSQNIIYSIIEKYRAKHKYSTLIISHDINFVAKNSTKVICLTDGKIGCEGDFHNIKNSQDIQNIWGNYTHIHNKEI